MSGEIREPTFVKGADNAAHAIIDPAIAHEVMQMLKTVVSPDSTAPQAAVPNYTVAGKTGTAHIAIAGGYAPNRYTALFCGIIPADNPRLVGVVVIRDAGQGGMYFGGLVSAPVFSQVMTGAMRLLDIPPDNVQRWFTGMPQPAAPLAVARKLPPQEAKP
jgi:cell division protein FtsI (penicillin-binding protein 3)